MFKGSSLKAIVDGVTSIALACLTIGMVWNMARPAVVESRSVPEKLEDATLDARALTKRLGSASPIIVEFADFECPYCGRHARDVFPRIKAELIDRGIASYAFMHFPLEQAHPNAHLIGTSAECAARQNRYWEMHSRLFATTQRRDADLLSKDAEGIGLDMAQYRLCMANAGAAVDHDLEQGRLLGVTGTPTFFVGEVRADGTIRLTGRLRGTVGFDSLRDAVAPVATWRVAALFDRLLRRN